MMRFRDRADAGRRLADRVAELGLRDPVVLALPRGGVPVAYEVAERLAAPLEVFVVRKVGMPGMPELGIGAVAEGGILVRTPAVPALLDRQAFEALAETEQRRLDQQVQRYRGTRPLPRLAGRDVVLVDDGLATGVTARAGLLAVREAHPARLVLAAPVCSPDAAAAFHPVADDVVCLMAPEGFLAVGEWYDDFGQTSDEEVLRLLAAGARCSEAS